MCIWYNLGSNDWTYDWFWLISESQVKFARFWYSVLPQNWVLVLSICFLSNSARTSSKGTACIRRGKLFLNRLYEHRCPSTKQKWQEIQVTWSNSYIQKLAVPCEFDARSPVRPASGAACSSSGSGLWSTTWGLLHRYIAIAKYQEWSTSTYGTPHS